MRCERIDFKEVKQILHDAIARISGNSHVRHIRGSPFEHETLVTSGKLTEREHRELQKALRDREH